MEINKVMEEFDIPFLIQSQEDNIINSIFLHSKETIEVTIMNIPQKITYYKGWIQKVKDDYKKKIGIFQPRNKQLFPYAIIVQYELYYQQK